MIGAHLNIATTEQQLVDAMTAAGGSVRVDRALGAAGMLLPVADDTSTLFARALLGDVGLCCDAAGSPNITLQRHGDLLSPRARSGAGVQVDIDVHGLHASTDCPIRDCPQLQIGSTG